MINQSSNYQPIDTNTRESISLLKGLSIFSVICAHCNSIPENSPVFATVSSMLLNNLGSIGVICFFIISGFLFRCENKKEFFSKKIWNLGAPWLVGSIIIYLYIAFRKPPISLSGLLNFMVGNGSYFYYLTILILLYVTFVFLRVLQSDVALVALIILSIVSGLFFADDNPLAPTTYLNYLNWVGYFAFGMLIRRHFQSFSLWFEKINKYRFVIYLAYIITLIYQIASSKGGYYFGISYMFFSWCGSLAFLALVQDIKRIKLNPLKKAIRDSGDFSLFIYIWHLPIAGIVANVFSYQPLIMLVLARPFIVLAVSLSAYYLLKHILKKLKWTSLGVVIGIRV